MKVLLIDDDEELCTELSEVLEAEGFEVDTVFDGAQGLKYLRVRQYQIIVLDLKLPGLSGYGVLESVKKSAHPLKVLVLSGKPMGNALLKENGVDGNGEEQILKMADAVMNKPFIVKEFLRQIKTLTKGIVENSQ
ncbi:MAG: response regulator [Candidatus Omnitrophica bacterium]|nr:response regulator [Candidatus Omnitrophota bacterium]